MDNDNVVQMMTGGMKGVLLAKMTNVKTAVGVLITALEGNTGAFLHDGFIITVEKASKDAEVS